MNDGNQLKSADQHFLASISGTTEESSREECGLYVPEELSLRAQVIARLVRWGVRFWPREDAAKLARRARQLFDLPNVLGFLSCRGIEIKPVQCDGVRGEWISLPDRKADFTVLLYIHGGGYVSCSAKSHRSITSALARQLPGRVFSLDYRLAPESPFPGAVDDAVNAYEWLLDQGVPAEKIAMAGDSAGGGLALAALLRLRQTGGPLPACTVCFSPWVDLTGTCRDAGASSGSVFQACDISALASLYLQGASPKHPEASPVFADLSGLPPLLIYAAQVELLTEDAVQLHARAIACGLESTLLLYPELPHVWQIYGGLLPESRLALAQTANFIKLHWKIDTNRQFTPNS